MRPTIQRRATARPSMLNEVWAIVNKNFYDKSKLRAWRHIGERYYSKAITATSHQEVIDHIQAMLEELGVSHLRLIEPDVFKADVTAEMENKQLLSFGMDIRKGKDTVYVSDVIDGGSAHEHGIIRGDELISINEFPATNSNLLRPSGSGSGFHISANAPIKLLVRRHSEVFDRHLSPKKWNHIDATRRSVHITSYEGILIGYIHLWHMTHQEIISILRTALSQTFENVQGLLLDLRGFGGNIQYPRIVSSMLMEWRRPTVAIIDSNTRSSKEVLAFLLRKNKTAVLVGERTKGAVLGGKFFPLSDGSHLIVPVLSCEHLTDGISLEKNGIKPDVYIKDDLGPRDPILEAAAKVLRGMVR